jgi:hypothetical protein
MSINTIKINIPIDTILFFFPLTINERIKMVNKQRYDIAFKIVLIPIENTSGIKNKTKEQTARQTAIISYLLFSTNNSLGIFSNVIIIQLK